MSSVTTKLNSIDALIEHFCYLTNQDSLGNAMSWCTAAMQFLGDKGPAHKPYLDLQQLWDKHGLWLGDITLNIYQGFDHGDQSVNKNGEDSTVVLDFIDAELVIATELHDHPAITGYGKALLEAC